MTTWKSGVVLYGTVYLVACDAFNCDNQFFDNFLVLMSIYASSDCGLCYEGYQIDLMVYPEIIVN